MTEIEKKAREIAVNMPLGSRDLCEEREEAARLGIIEGLEMAAKVAEQWDENSPHNSRAAAIRALIEGTGETFTRPSDT